MATLDDFLKEWHSDKDYVCAFTSGSTGKPKEIRLLKSDMVASARLTNRFFEIDSDSVLAIPLSFDYIAAKMMAVRACVAGCRIVELPVSNNIDIAGNVDLLSVVPTQLESLLSVDGIRSKVKNVLIGGAPLSHSMEEMIAESGINAWLSYGMTETCSHVAVRRVGGDGVFHGMSGLRFNTDSRGCLTIESETFSWRRLATNDLADVIDPTSFRWLGRIDNVINSGGLKISPELTESVYIRALPSLKPFYLVGEPDPVLGERVVMVTTDSDVENLAEKLREHISDHKILPKRIISVDSLPMTARGKLRRIVPLESRH